jgi:hypothetical protein
MLTVLLSNLGLGSLAWLGVLGGSLIGLAIAILVVSRRHPFADQVRYADGRPADSWSEVGPMRLPRPGGR